MLRTHNLARDVGQLLVGGFDGETPPHVFRDLVREGSVGGAILFSRNFSSPESARVLTDLLSRLPSPEPLSLSLDQEGGRVQRLRAPFPELPPMRAFGDARRKTLAHRAGRLIGRALVQVGFHQNYAPVLDVDTNPENPIIGDRAFSRDPSSVARLGAALIDGLQGEGCAGCGKHFPGHGDTSTDSHLELPLLPHALDRLHRVELVPFRAAARAEVAAIMTAHIVFEALDPHHPATLSESVLVPLLREDIGFRGVIVSDDLEMKAISDHYGVEDAAVRAIRAGCDQLLICRHPELVQEAHRAIVQAVERGALAAARVVEAAGRVRAMKARFVRPAPALAADVVASLPLSDHRALLEDLARAPESTPRGEAITEYAFEGDPNEEIDLDV